MSGAIFELRLAANDYAGLQGATDDDIDAFIDGFEAEPLATTWLVPEVKLIAGYGHGVAPADFMTVFGAVPAVSRRVRDCIGPLLEETGEFLPLRSDVGPYWAYNVLAVVDILDVDLTEGEWLGPGRLLTLRSLAVKEDAPPVPPVFKLPQWRGGSALVTATFLDAVAANGLTGLAPVPVFGGSGETP